MLQLQIVYILYITSAISAPEHTESVDHYASIIDSTSSLKDFIVYVRNKTRNGLFDEYQEIKSQPPDGVFDHVRLGVNRAQKYTDVMCYNHTKVIPV